MKLYYSPGACSLAVHILLEEIGIPFELEKVLTGNGSTRAAQHLAINPKGQVPVLDLGTERLTEASAILLHLTLTYGKKIGIDTASDKLVKTIEWMSWLSTGVHCAPVTQIWNPGRLSDEPAAHASIQAKGQKRLREVYTLIEAKIPESNYVLGKFCAADASLLVYYRWGNRLGLDMRAQFPNWTKHTQTMLTRSAVIRALQTEDISVWS